MKTCYWYSLEALWQATSGEYPQHMFSWRNKKKYQYFWVEKKHLIWSYVCTYSTPGPLLLYRHATWRHWASYHLGNHEKGDQHHHSCSISCLLSLLLGSLAQYDLSRHTWKFRLIKLRFYHPVNPLGTCLTHKFRYRVKLYHLTGHTVVKKINSYEQRHCKYILQVLILAVITRGPRATARSPKRNSHCKYAFVMQYFFNSVIATNERIII